MNYSGLTVKLVEKTCVDLMTGSGCCKMFDMTVPQRRVIKQQESFYSYKENSICYYKSLQQLF